MTSLFARLPTIAPAVLLLGACGSAPASSSWHSAVSAATAPPTHSPAPSVTLDPNNPALFGALTAAEVSSAAGNFTQTSDSLLGGTLNTDSRLFTSAGGGTVVEIDVAVDTGAAAATSDYAAYRSAAAGQVPNVTSQSTTSLGQASAEYLGSNAAGKMVCSLSFVDGRYIGVVTVISNGGATTAAVQTTAESIARTEDTKMNGVGS